MPMIFCTKQRFLYQMEAKRPLERASNIDFRSQRPKIMQTNIVRQISQTEDAYHYLLLVYEKSRFLKASFLFMINASSYLCHTPTFYCLQILLSGIFQSNCKYGAIKTTTNESTRFKVFFLFLDERIKIFVSYQKMLSSSVPFFRYN